MKSLTSRFREEVFQPYIDFLKSEYRFHASFKHAKRVWDGSLNEAELIHGPFLEKAQFYASGEPLENLQLASETCEAVRNKLGDRRLYKHQTDALKLILSGGNAAIATGTSSGKTLCYQIPIMDDLVRNPAPGLRAIIIYPLNALVNDQLNEWEALLSAQPQITFGRFTGQTPMDQKEYEERERAAIKAELGGKGMSQRETEASVASALKKRLSEQAPNRLNHRNAIRKNPPNILITNFSMLEYLLVRPVDASIFEGSRLKFLVMDEVHAYRGVQATEIAFLIRRLKDRLGVQSVVSIATSATLGDPHDLDSRGKVRLFAARLFGEPFEEPNPISGTSARPCLAQPSICPKAKNYIEAAEASRRGEFKKACWALDVEDQEGSLRKILEKDENLYRLRSEILASGPNLLANAAIELWPGENNAQEGLEALLELTSGQANSGFTEDLLPSRLHYFLRAPDGLHLCLRLDCPGRTQDGPTFFLSRKNGDDVPEGYCPECHRIGRASLLLEVVTCRKCGYLYGAMQDLGPRRARNRDESISAEPHFDSFSTELGWAGDSFWSYLSVDKDLPFPFKSDVLSEDDDEDEGDLLSSPAILKWCAACGKKSDPGAGDNCKCVSPHLREIKIFHRQCPHSGRAKDMINLEMAPKHLLHACPNCGAQNASGIEPLRRFQESDDEIGLAIAIPLAHFQVTTYAGKERPPRKLLCFTDHRQRAAAFPAMLEEETFQYDLGKKIVQCIRSENRPLTLMEIGEALNDYCDEHSPKYDPFFFLPMSRLPDDMPEPRNDRELWNAEAFNYFGIPDAARESAEDFGILQVRFLVSDAEQRDFLRLLSPYSLHPEEGLAILQTLLAHMRHRKAFTLPRGVPAYSPAFGRVLADLSFDLQKDGRNNVLGWLPRINTDCSYRDNYVTDYLKRLLGLTPDQTLSLAECLWSFIAEQFLIRNGAVRKLDHERLLVEEASSRWRCERCGIAMTFQAKGCCPRKGCAGHIVISPFDAKKEGIVARWVSGIESLGFSSLRSEEHTAQINKELARKIEERFRAEIEDRSWAAEGVNLLSSTTTFELGINIGDLQKILLRNAPPSSASYVQRVGRSGRGKDKNAVCVTICRRTKYDADAWQEPQRLLSGAVKPPNVFTENIIVAQRHFNAVLLSKFLRKKVIEEGLLKMEKQSIRVAAFIRPDERKGIPPDWLQLPEESTFLDFGEWCSACPEEASLCGHPLLARESAFQNALARRDAMLETYKKIMEGLLGELQALKLERQRSHDLGRDHDAKEWGDSIRRLLRTSITDLLAKRGFLPRYAFPLDVVTLETGRTRWSGDSDVELSRDRGLAISEFAPGSQVVARKRVFTSAGLYIVGKKDGPERRWYLKCPECGQVRVCETKEPLKTPCVVCGRPSVQWIKPYVEPTAFSISFDPNLRPERHRRSSLIRQRQGITHFVDSVNPDELKQEGAFRLALKESGNLFRYNLGPQNKGFFLCAECGYSRSMAGGTHRSDHSRLRPRPGEKKCSRQLWTDIAFGHQFTSFCLVARTDQPLENVQSLAFALQRGAVNLLELDPLDIGVCWRRASAGMESGMDIVLYDNTPGGAGYVRECRERWADLISLAREICSGCLCDRACYECLKTYGNQAHHDSLNRHLVLDFFSGSLAQ